MSMKKSIFLLAAAAAAFASCTQNEVMEVAENRAIGFSSFVNNNTRAVTETTTDNLTTFFVFGDYDNGASIAFSNTQVNGVKGGDYTPVNPAYWQTGKNYTFGAYSNAGASLSGASFSNGTLSITGYSAGVEDLVAATATATAPAEGTEQSVALTFSHLLSKIKFTFSTDAVPEAYRMEVSNLKFTGIKTEATCEFSNNAISTDWTGTEGEYSIATLNDYAVTGGSASTEEILVIPQANNTITASFTVTLYDEKTGAEIDDNEFTAPLNCTEWTEGHVYNYTATIDPDDIDGNLKPIIFTVKVNDWDSETSVPTTPNQVPQP